MLIDCNFKVTTSCANITIITSCTNKRRNFGRTATLSKVRLKRCSDTAGLDMRGMLLREHAIA